MRTTLLLPFALLLSACGAPLPAGNEGGLPADAAAPTDIALPADAASSRCKTAADCNKPNTDCCDGACIDVGADPTNCGGCGKACHAVTHGAPACSSGQCTAACDPNFADCDQSLMNGCEADLTSDPAHCGACDTSCANLPNAQSSCVKSTCGVTSCNQGFSNCDNNPINGCEVNLGSDPANCGGCAKTCPKYANASAVCMNGGCSLGPCAMGFSDCDNLPANGCETSTAADLANCGGCGRPCATPNGTPACMAGICTIAACNGGYADCDKMAATGCEVQVSTDPANCGGCGKVCPVPANASASCTAGQCSAACKFGFGDCNKNLGDGCEAALATDVTNCGQCGMQCAVYANSTPACSAGQCGIGMCQGLFGNCDGILMNGCEKALAADVNNCGACGKVCNFQNGQGACLNGQCGLFSCDNGFGNCDANDANGCEANFASDSKHCSKCGMACPVNQNCVNGACQACGNDCWSANGCPTQGGRCIQFSCRPGGANPNFCNGCKGWKEISYQQWMNGGYCLDVIAKYHQVENNATKCGGQNLSCCGSSNACSGGDNAWHFWDGANTRFVGPPLGDSNNSNCSNWDSTELSGYTRITVCERP